MGERAAHACLWLGACVGVGDLNDLGNCYPLAQMAYDCKLNPNQRVHGALHEFWDKPLVTTDYGSIN